MSDVVFILGAGASKQCGVPLMADFLDVAKNLLLTDKVNDKKEQFEKVFKAVGALQAAHSKAQLNLTNIESIFTALEMANLLQKLPGFNAEDISEVIASLKEVIVRTIELTMEFPVRNSYIKAPKPYDKFADLIEHLRHDAFPQQSSSIITFNYDIAIEVALLKVEMSPDYGIESSTNPNNSIPVYKLHGSLNWAIDKETNTIYPLPIDQYISSISKIQSKGSIGKISIGSQLKNYFSKHHNKEVREEPLIVPPTWDKGIYYELLSKIWSRAASHLGEAKSIFIIGYSLPETDMFFRLLYALGTIGPFPLEKIIVYNPDDSGEVDRRFRGMLGPGAVERYEYKKLTFDEAIIDIENKFPGRKRRM